MPLSLSSSTKQNPFSAALNAAKNVAVNLTPAGPVNLLTQALKRVSSAPATPAMYNTNAVQAHQQGVSALTGNKINTPAVQAVPKMVTPTVTKAATATTTPANTTSTPPKMGLGATTTTTPTTTAQQTNQPVFQANPQSIASNVNQDIEQIDLSKANAAVDEATRRLSDFRQQRASQNANISEKSIFMPFAQGRQALFAQQAAETENALTNELNAAIENRRQITDAAAAKAAARTELLRTSLPGQQPLTSTLYNPLTGSSVEGSGNIIDRSILAGNVASASDLTQKRNDISSSYNQVKGLQSNLMQQLQNNGLNVTTLPLLNKAIADILRRGVGDPNYQGLRATLSELGNSYNAIFSRGGSVTDEVRKSTDALINGNASPEDIEAVLTVLDSNAQKILGGIDQQINQLSQSGSTGGASYGRTANGGLAF